ncbi:MAG: hypothetical protein CO128_08485 [Ignavibacteriales bacterium CG_4_9_14_3_um_filter_30_11]|nr:MAG: hypothetical protein CO128_08485 [Ignavibacteriales bacterium CG_4_9_14_3_um_filter_30_11]
MKKNLIFILIIISVYSSQFFGQTISAEAKVDSLQYLIGDYIKFNITAEYSNEIKLIKPNIIDSIKNLEIIETKTPWLTVENNNKKISYTFILAKYDSGNVTIPSINLFYIVGKDSLDSKILNSSDAELLSNPKVRVITTNPVSFRVNLVQIDLQKDIKDVKDPLKIPFNLKELLIYALIAIVIIGGLIYLYYWYKKKGNGIVEDKKIIKHPPHITALNQLRILREEGLWQQGKIKEYHSRITEIIRNYFEERFNLPALELTTGETIEKLMEKKETEVILDSTQSFLSNADLVKFAKYVPLKSLNEEMMSQAEEIINKTKMNVVSTKNEEVNV